MSWSESKWSPGEEYHDKWSRSTRRAEEFSPWERDVWKSREARSRRRDSRERDDVHRDAGRRERSNTRNYERDLSPRHEDERPSRYDDDRPNRHNDDRPNRHNDDRPNRHDDFGFRDKSVERHTNYERDRGGVEDDRKGNSNNRRRSPRRRSRSPNYALARGSRSVTRSPPREAPRHRDRSDHSRSSPPDQRQDESDRLLTMKDWYCKCGALNFKRRNICYWRDCGAKREDAAIVTPRFGSTSDNMSSGMTRILLLRPIGPKTAAEDILSALSLRCEKVASTMSGVSLVRGGARLQFNTLQEASIAFTEINALHPALQIGGHSVRVGYYSDKAVVAAELPAPVNPDYTAFYSAYSSETDRVNAAAAVAQSAINQLNAVRSQWVTPIIVQPAMVAPVPPKGDGSQSHQPPDTSTFMYDESSGFYYDATTGLYYDAKTQYFYNNQIGRYMYWDAAKSTYLLAPVAKSEPSTSDDNAADTSKDSSNDLSKDDKKKNILKEDKVKVAKKIAKDMERWAKTLNQKKENARNGIVVEQQLQQAAASIGSADIGYRVLEKSEARASVPSLPTILPPSYSAPLPFKADIEHSADINLKSLPVDDDENIIDWQKLSCLLCKRQFNSTDILKKHIDISNLHKENLMNHRKNELNSDSYESNLAKNYRDRAAERRLKFGEEDTPPFKPPPPAVTSRGSFTAAPPEPQPLDATSVGGRLLSKMGWSEGTGLGRSRSGRTSPVRADRRSNLAGLGQKRGVYQAAPGESYRDTVKKLAMARYQDLLQEEDDKKT